MHHRNVDVAVIGAGTAGLAAYRAAVQHTHSVVLVEEGPGGTTCARVGCMPSKLLIAAAEAAHDVERAGRFGIHVPGPARVDGRAVLARVRTERDRFVGFVERGVEALPAAHRVAGRARFVAPHALEVTPAGGGAPTELIRAGRVVIATGSAPTIPAAFRAFGDRLVVNDDVFQWESLPRSVAVFGPGVIGLELGQALHRLGVRTHVYGVGNVVGPLGDPVVAAVARAAFAAELTLDADAKVSDFGVDGDGAQLTVHGAAGARVERYDRVLVATGRAPRLAGLGLEQSGLALDARGVPLFDAATMRCGESHVFIAGDADNDRPVLHEAADEGAIAGANAGRFPDVRPGARRAPLTIMFTDPQLAVVGAGYRRLEAQYGARGELAIGHVSFDDQGRSRVMLRNQGALRVYAERGTGRFLGAELAAPRGEHLAHLLAWALQARLTVSDMLAMPFYHPVVEEGVRTALRELASDLARPAVAA